MSVKITRTEEIEAKELQKNLSGAEMYNKRKAFRFNLPRKIASFKFCGTQQNLAQYIISAKFNRLRKYQS